MNKLKLYLPEACCLWDDLRLRDVQKALKKHTTIVGITESVNESEKHIVVRLGSDLFAYLPFSEVTMYHFSYPKDDPEQKLPYDITNIMHEKICCKVKSIEGTKIILSRKDNMLEAYQALKNERYLPFHVTAVKDKSVFGDVGQGLKAMMMFRDLCKSRIRSANEICHKGQDIFVVVRNFDENKRANVSYKDTFPKYRPEDYLYNQIITGTINGPAFTDNVHTGFFVNVTPQVVGIVDLDPRFPHLSYGDKIECSVHEAEAVGLRLRIKRIIKNAD